MYIGPLPPKWQHWASFHQIDREKERETQKILKLQGGLCRGNDNGKSAKSPLLCFKGLFRLTFTGITLKMVQMVTY